MATPDIPTAPEAAPTPAPAPNSTVRPPDPDTDPDGWKTYGWLHQLHREAHGLKILTVANRIGVEPRDVAAMERGEGRKLNTSAANTAALAEHLRQHGTTAGLPRLDRQPRRTGWVYAGQLLRTLRLSRDETLETSANAHGLKHGVVWLIEEGDGDRHPAEAATLLTFYGGILDERRRERLPAVSATAPEPRGPRVTSRAKRQPAMADIPALPSARRGPRKPVELDLPATHIGHWIQAQMVGSGLSQVEFAASIGKSQQSLSNIRHGRQLVSRGFVEAIIATHSPGTTFEEVQSKFPAGFSSRQRGHRSGTSRSTRRGARTVEPKTPPPPDGYMLVPRVPRVAPAVDTTSDEAFETRVDSILVGRHAPRDAGWARVARIIRHARIEAGRTLDQQVAAHGEIARSVETGGGHESPVRLAATLALAHALAAEPAVPSDGTAAEGAAAPGGISAAELDSVERTIRDLAQRRLRTAAGRIASTLSGFHYPGWERSQWPGLAAYLTAEREVRGQSVAEAAAELAVPTAALWETENGGAYDPSFPVADGERIDLRSVAERALRRAAEFRSNEAAGQGLELIDDKGLASFERLLTTEQSRDHHSYRSMLESRTPAGADDWRNLAVEIYRERRRWRYNRARQATEASVPVSVVSELETGRNAATHRGFYDVQLLTARLFRGANPLLNEFLARHHSWLTRETVERLKEQPTPPFDGWRDSGLPELGVALLDAREKAGLTQAALAKSCDATREDIADAEEGFGTPDSLDSGLARRLVETLGFTEEARGRHAAALNALAEQNSTTKAPPSRRRGRRPGTSTKAMLGHSTSRRKPAR